MDKGLLVRLMLKDVSLLIIVTVLIIVLATYHMLILCQCCIKLQNLQITEMKTEAKRNQVTANIYATGLWQSQDLNSKQSYSKVHIFYIGW